MVDHPGPDRPHDRGVRDDLSVVIQLPDVHGVMLFAADELPSGQRSMSIASDSVPTIATVSNDSVNMSKSLRLHNQAHGAHDPEVEHAAVDVQPRTGREQHAGRVRRPAGQVTAIGLRPAHRRHVDRPRDRDVPHAEHRRDARVGFGQLVVAGLLTREVGTDRGLHPRGQDHDEQHRHVRRWRYRYPAPAGSRASPSASRTVPSCCVEPVDVDSERISDRSRCSATRAWTRARPTTTR